MILTKSHIEKAVVETGEIFIDSYDKENLNPNSYDVTLSNKIAWYPNLENFTGVPVVDEDTDFHKYGMSAVSDESLAGYVNMISYLDPAKDNILIEKTIPEEGVILLPNILYLGMLNETIYSSKYVMELTGKSTLARLGIIIHNTAGYSNIGHHFKYVLEISVIHPIRIYPNMKIGQIFFHTATEENSANLYDGKYSIDQIGDHISSPKPIKIPKEIVEKRASAYSIAISHEDIRKYNLLKGDNNLHVNGDKIESSVVKEGIVPFVRKDDEKSDEAHVTSFQFK